MATTAVGESFDSTYKKKQQLQQQSSYRCPHISSNDNSQYSDSDPKSGYCNRTGIYRSVFKLGAQHVIPRDHNLDFASFILSKLPPQHVSETKTAIVDSDTGNGLTYSYLRRYALSLAATLHHGLGLGRRKGEDVILLLLSPNCTLYPAICLGILASGAIVAPVDPLTTCVDQVAQQVSDFGAKLAISSPGEAHKAEATGIPVLLTTAANTTQRSSGFWPLLSVEELMEGGDALEAPSPSQTRTTQSDVAAIFYSSDSKSNRKLVTLTHGNLISMSVMIKWGVEKEMISSLAAADEVQDAFLCIVQPMSHVLYGMGMLCTGSTMVLMNGSRFDIGELLEAVDKYRINNIMNLAAVPTPLLMSAMNCHAGGRQNLSLLRKVTSVGGGSYAGASGAKASQVRREFRRRFPWVAVMEGYGLYGSGLMATMFASEEEARRDNDDDRSARCAGKLLPLLEGRVVEVKSGRTVGPGAVGELCLRGPTIITTYGGKAEAEQVKKEAIDEDGWLRTGDLAYFDRDGFLYIVDTIEDLIDHKGYQVSPAELEALLATHPQILDVAVIPLQTYLTADYQPIQPNRVADQKPGQLLMAYVVRTSSAENALTFEEVIRFAATKVSPHKKIEKVAFVNDIPRSASGRILRKQLAAQNQKAIIPAKL